MNIAVLDIDYQQKCSRNIHMSSVFGDDRMDCEILHWEVDGQGREGTRLVAERNKRWR